MEKYNEALADATKCVELKKDWPKGYIRKGFAEVELKKFDEAIATYKTGLEVDP